MSCEPDMRGPPMTAKKPVRPAPRLPWARIAWISALLILAGSAVYAAQQVELFLIRDSRFALATPAEYGDESPGLHLEGIRYASRLQVLRVFQQDVGRSLYLFPLADRRKALLKLPWVKDAAIERIWPNQITVRLTEREPAAFLQLQSEGIARYPLIDGDGVILEPPARTLFDLPVLIGIRTTEAAPMRGLRVRRMQRLLKDLGTSAGKVSEVDVSDLDELKVRVKVDGRSVLLMLGDRNFGARFQEFLDHYDEIQKRISDTAVIDLRLDDRITVVGGSRRD